MPNIDYKGKEYFSYADIAQADDYLSPTEYGEVWGILSDDEKAAYLIQSTRFLDSLPWKEKCGKTNVEREQNQSIVNACIDIAGRLSGGETDIISGGSSDGGIHTLKAGSAELSYFQKKSWRLGNSTTGTLLDGIPASILSTIRNCLDVAPSVLIGKSKSFGTCYPSTLHESWKIE